jgi:hypothetical protein
MSEEVDGVLFLDVDASGLTLGWMHCIIDSVRHGRCLDEIYQY